MEPRVDYQKMANSGAAKAMYGIEHFVRDSGLENKLLDLVRMRVSD